MTEQAPGYQDNDELWLKLALKELKDKPISELHWKNSTGLSFQPYYTLPNRNRFPAFTTKNKNEWDIVESIEVTNVSSANKQALEALNAGASCLIFQIQNTEQLNWNTLLKNIELSYITLTLESAVNNWKTLLVGLMEYCEAQSINTGECTIVLQDMPQLYPSGAAWAEALELALTESKVAREILPMSQINWVEASFLGHAGLNSDTELAIALALRNFMLEQDCQDSDFYPVGLSVSTDYYTELAKFRIAPALFKLVSDKFQSTNQPYIKASMNKGLVSHLDAYSNILRMGTAAMSAIVGGCNALQLTAFDPIHDNSEFIQRITRNIQLVLLHESGLADANDAAAGSSFFESLCYQLSEQVWDHFLSIQQHGGLLNYLRSGELDALLSKQKEEKLASVREGNHFLLGVNKYLNKSEVGTDYAVKEGVFSANPWSVAMLNQSINGGEQ